MAQSDRWQPRSVANNQNCPDSDIICLKLNRLRSRSQVDDFIVISWLDSHPLFYDRCLVAVLDDQL